MNVLPGFTERVVSSKSIKLGYQSTYMAILAFNSQKLFTRYHTHAAIDPKHIY
jgi:hypothetical protein